jgi:hypothetical protein
VTEIPVNETIRAVWDSGLSTEHPSSPIYWLDDDTVVVSANSGGRKSQTPEELRTREIWIYLWRLGEKPRRYPNVVTKGPYCAARGEISYHLDIVDPKTGAPSHTRWLGPPGQEREVAPWNQVPMGGARNPLGWARNSFSIERIDCEIYADPAMAGKFYVTDSDHRFYLDFGSDDPAMVAVHAKPEQPIALLRSDGSGRVPLPISNALANPSSTYFHKLDGQFYLFNRTLTASPINNLEFWRESNCWPIWRVDPQTAKTERLCIPFGPWSGAHGGATTLFLAPTRAGLFFSANSINPEDESGFYRLENGAVFRIFPGDMWYPTLSPNGCRVAFTKTDKDRSQFGVFWNSIIAIDLCSPKAGVSPSPN